MAVPAAKRRSKLRPALIAWSPKFAPATATSRYSRMVISSACLPRAGFDQPPSFGEHLLLDTATLSVLGYYYDTPALKIWNAPIAG